MVSGKIAFAGLLLSIFAACCLLIMTQFESIIGLILFIFLFFLGINITLPNALSMALKGYESVIGTASGILVLSITCLLVSLPI